MDNSLPPLAPVFRALADPTRMAVLARLSAGPASVSALAQPFDMALPSFLKHLAVMEESGLIATRKQGRVRICELRPECLESAETWLARQRALWEGRTDRLAATLR